MFSDTINIMVRQESNLSNPIFNILLSFPNPNYFNYNKRISDTMRNSIVFPGNVSLLHPLLSLDAFNFKLPMPDFSDVMFATSKSALHNTRCYNQHFLEILIIFVGVIMYGFMHQVQKGFSSLVSKFLQNQYTYIRKPTICFLNYFIIYESFQP